MHDIEIEDLTLPFSHGRFDFVLSLEVAEHIPSAQLPMFLSNLARHALRGAVVSWSWCGAPGERHVSCRSPAEAAKMMASVGFVVDKEASRRAQEASSVWWIKRTVQVYWKRTIE